MMPGFGSAARALAAASLMCAMPAAAQQQATWTDRDVAVLQGLDKITARVWTFEARTGATVRFGTLELRVEACRKRPPDEPPDSAAFIEIRETPVDPGSPPLFRGWMFASSPALSSLEHAVYDVWVLECR
ncbi:MAG: DUF2155 domain-containing protein [Alphaproteobacteria bacterium]